MKRVVCLVVAVCLVSSCSLSAQSNAVNAPQSGSASVADHIGFGVKVGLLGAGAELAARIDRHSNIRAGFNVLGYSRSFDKDGINYDGHLSFRTIEAHYDYYPWAGKFHVSGGLLDYIGNPITANAFVPGGSSFTLGGQTYYSQNTNPAFASGKVDFNQVSPTVTFGWGNLVRENHHFSVPIELGIAFQGSPKSALGLTGNVCTDQAQTQCFNAATDPTVQSNVLAEQTKLNNSMKPFKFYPIISIGFGYKF
jgi:hypothetical protein